MSRQQTSPGTFEGGCLCGAIRYRATEPPVRGVLCHCPMCRRHSGAPALAFVHFPAASFTWLAAQPTWYRSSPPAERGFCSVCGSTVAMREEVLADRVQVCVGTLDQADADRVQIDDHVWTRHRLAWFDTTDQLPRFSGSSPAAPSQAAAGSGPT
jgi:hypothetical protein